MNRLWLGMVLGATGGTIVTQAVTVDAIVEVPFAEIIEYNAICPSGVAACSQIESKYSLDPGTCKNLDVVETTYRPDPNKPGECRFTSRVEKRVRGDFTP